MGDAYMQFGFAGMAVFAVILALILKVIDGVAARIPFTLACGVIAVPAMSLVNSALFTVLLTHGFIAAGVALWAISASRERPDG